MTFTEGPAMRPQVGGFYDLRAGLKAFINGRVDIHGIIFFRGLVLDPTPMPILWHESGAYSSSPHELDIVAETAY